jgi:hypothetical protein
MLQIFSFSREDVVCIGFRRVFCSRLKHGELDLSTLRYDPTEAISPHST